MKHFGQNAHHLRQLTSPSTRQSTRCCRRWIKWVFFPRQELKNQVEHWSIDIAARLDYTSCFIVAHVVQEEQQRRSIL